MTFKLTTHSFFAALLPVALALGAGTAHAQPAPQGPQGPQDPYDPDDDVDEPDESMPQDTAPAEAPPVQPQTAQPRQVPPAPPASPPQPPQAQVQIQAQAPVQAQPAPSAGGQWVYTQQYGWIWMPYGDQYVYGAGENPYEYVYYPAYGWTWITAPWLFGWGPRVYFSVGPRYFTWFHRPFIHRPFYRPFGGRAVLRGGVRAPIHGAFRGNVGGSRFIGGHVGGHFSGGGHISSGGHFSGGHGGGHFSGGHGHH